MKGDLTKLLRAAASTSLALGLVLGTGRGPGLGEEGPSARQIIDALKPGQLTRSLDTSPPAPFVSRPSQDSQFVDSLRNRPPRSITHDEREKIAAMAEDKRGLDLEEITFRYNSAMFAPSAMATARHLGEALASPELKGSTYLIAGYTDAKGGDDFNQKLSERRAAAVKNFLVSRYAIQASNLVAVGYGKSNLKNPADPFAAENRRVRIVNLTADVANR